MQRALIQSDALDVEQSLVDGCQDVLQAFGDLVQPGHIHFVGGEEETEEHACAEDGRVSREERLEAAHEVLQVAHGPRGSVYPLDHLTELIHLEFDVLGDVDEGLVDDLVEVLLLFERTFVLAHNLVVFFISHRVRFRAGCFAFIALDHPKLVTVRSAQFLAQHAL